MTITRDMITESHQGSVAKTDMELYCKDCGKTLKLIKKGSMMFRQTKGRCTCSWKCCKPSGTDGTPHDCHLDYREKI